MSTAIHEFGTGGGDRTLPLVIVNPMSAGGSTESRWASVAADLRTHFGPFEAAFTRFAGDAISIAERESQGGRRLIIACGGDGTINEVANGILRANSNTELAILPSGTGGDFRRTLKIPGNTRDAASALRTGKTRRIDVGKVTFVSHDGNAGERFFLNVSSVGLATSIIRRVKSSPSFEWLPIQALRGRANFAASTLREVADLEASTISVRIDDDEPVNLQTINFCVANAQYFGGGMMIAPDAKLNDGRLDVVNIGDISSIKILFNAHTLYRGTHTSLKEVGTRLASRIEVKPFSPSERIPLETDGELPGRLPAVYSILPAALAIRVPE